MTDTDPPSLSEMPPESTPGMDVAVAEPVTDVANHAKTLRDQFWVIGPAALLLAFFWQPALKLIAPFILTSISSLLVFGLVVLEIAASVSRRRLRLGLYGLGAVLGMIGAGEAIYFTARAVPVSDANDRRCLKIETHMLSNVAGRAGDAAMFQALGCRPQGTDQGVTSSAASPS